MKSDLLAKLVLERHPCLKTREEIDEMITKIHQLDHPIWVDDFVKKYGEFIPIWDVYPYLIRWIVWKDMELLILNLWNAQPIYLELEDGTSGYMISLILISAEIEIFSRSFREKNPSYNRR